MHMFIALGSIIISIINITWFLSATAVVNHYYIVSISFFVLAIWIISSLTLHKICNISLIRAFRLDAFTYLISFILFLYLVRMFFPELTSSKFIKLITGICYVTFIYTKAGLFLYFYKKNRMAVYNVSPIKIGLTLFFFVFIFYATLALWTDLAIAPTGDEPYYLLAAKSLISDRDLDISNNYKAMQWKEFMPEGYRLSIWSSRRIDGRIYMDERVLFITFLAIPYLFGGFLGTSLFMVFLSSTLIYLIYYYMLEVGFEAKKSFWVSLLVACTQPMLNMNSRIYHNVLGAVLILLAFLCLSYKSRTTATALIAAAIILALPWLHASYITFSVTLFLIFLVTYHRSKLLSIFLISLTIIDVIIFILYRLYVVEGITDIAGFHQYHLTSHIYRSVFGLFFDQEGGLFFLAPIYVFSFIGFVTALVMDHSFKVIARIILLFSGFLVLQGSLPVFGGGYDTGRSLIQTLPFMAIFLRRTFENNKFNPLIYALGTISVFIGYLMGTIPWLAVNYETGRNIFLKQFAKIFYLDIPKYFPSFNIYGHEYYPFIMLFLVIVVLIGYLNKPQFNWR